MAEKQAPRLNVFVPGPARGGHSKLAPDDTWEARDLQNREEFRKRIEAKEAKKLQQEAEECLTMSLDEIEQWKELKLQQEDSRQNAAQSPSATQPAIQHAFNPNAPEFVSSKLLKRTDAQTCRSQISSKPLNFASMMSQAKGVLLDRHSTSSEPASPKIPAMTSSQTASSVQETHGASVRPSPTQDSAKAAASSTSPSQHSLSALPNSGADSGAAVQSIAPQSARGWLTVDAVRTAEETACIRQDAELEEQRLLGSDFSTSRRVQEDLSKILDITTNLAALISSDHTEDRDRMNKLYIGVAAVAAARRASKTEAVEQAQATQASVDDNVL